MTAEVGAARAHPEAADSGSPAGADEFRPVKSATRVLEVLEVLATSGPLTLRDLAVHLDVPKSSMHALLRTMQWRGWLETDPTGSRYGLGVRSLLTGSAYVDSDPVVRQTAAVLDHLAQQTGETVHLGRLEGGDVVYLAKRESTHPLRLFSSVGRRLPAYSVALGKAMLAEMTPDVALSCLPDRLQAMTEKTITDQEALLADLATARSVGYAVDDEESASDLRCFGVALRHRSATRDAISISVPLVRLDDRREQEIVELLLEARHSLAY